MLPKLEDVFLRSKKNRLISLFDLTQFAICVLIIGFHIFILNTARLEPVENGILSYFFKHRPPVAAHPDIVLVEIDKESIAAIGDWPWPLRYHSEIIKTLADWGAKAVVLDFVFPESESPEEKAAFLETIKSASQLYLPVTLEYKAAKKFWIHSMPVVLEPENEKKIWSRSDADIEKNAKAVGHNNLYPDFDGVVRRVPVFLAYEGQTVPYLPLLAAYETLGEKIPSPIDLDLSLPLDSKHQLMVNWTGRSYEDFKHYSYSSIVRSAQSRAKGRDAVIRPENIRGKICWIGLSAPGVADFKITPLESSYPAFAVHANVLNNILTKNFMRSVPKSTNAFAMAMIGFAAALLFVLFRSGPSFVAGLLMGAGWVIFSYFLFVRQGIWIYAFQPLFLILTLFIFSAIYSQIANKREQSRLFHLATRDGLTGLFVIRHFREILNREVDQAQTKKEPLSVILIDIDNFKPINDTFGHPAGDMVLKKTAQIICGQFRSRRPIHQVDFAARYGGEEFIVLVRRAPLKEASLKVAERIRAAVEKGIFEWDGKSIKVTISLGVASLHQGENVPDLMVRRADEALYRAKRAGKNQVCIETFATG